MSVANGSDVKVTHQRLKKIVCLTQTRIDSILSRHMAISVILSSDGRKSFCNCRIFLRVTFIEPYI